MKPILFCDIDGVINVPKNSHDNLVETNVKHLNGIPNWLHKGFHYRPQVADFIQNINTEIIWLTAWQKFAPPSLDSLFGINSEGFLPWRHNFIQWFTDKQHFQKSVALNRWVENNPEKPFIWIDDYAVQFADKYSFSKREDVLIIRPETRKGMTDEHISLMNSFVNSF